MSLPVAIAAAPFVALVFLTRFRVSIRLPELPLARTVWAWPLIGLFVGFLIGLSLIIARAIGLPPLPATIIAVAIGVLATGALHEDGLADIADGFGGGRDRAAKLSIMRDSRVGAYGVLVLIIAILLRTAALASFLPRVDYVFLLIVPMAAHAGGRAAMAVALRLLPPAREDGLGAVTGRPSWIQAIIAAILGGLPLLAIGPAKFSVSLGTGAVLAAAVVAAIAVGWLARRQIGGQTGDVLGAICIATEIAALLAASAFFGHGGSA